jgi:hypothetical protein
MAMTGRNLRRGAGAGKGFGRPVGRSLWWGVLSAALATVAGMAVATPAFGAQPAGGGARPASVAAGSGGTSCPTGDAALVFANDSGLPDTQVFGVVTLTAGTVYPTPRTFLATTTHPTASVPFSTFPAVSGERNSFYIWGEPVA